MVLVLFIAASLEGSEIQLFKVMSEASTGTQDQMLKVISNKMMGIQAQTSATLSTVASGGDQSQVTKSSSKT